MTATSTDAEEVAMTEAAPRRDPERREQLLQAAARAVEVHGASVRMEDIATEAGVTKPILYRHFGGKGGLYEALARRAATELMDRLSSEVETGQGNPRDRIRRTVDAFLEAIEERPELYRFLLGRAAAERPAVSQTVGDFTYQLADRVTQIVEEEYERFGLRPRAPRVVSHAMIGAAQAVADWWLATGELSRDDLVDALVTLLWNGIPALGTPAE
jgi:AcrR family transcriptional regulator